MTNALVFLLLLLLVERITASSPYNQFCALKFAISAIRFRPVYLWIFHISTGKGFGNGFPVTCVAAREQYKDSFESISASSSYGGNPMACAAALACIEAIEEENLLQRATHLGELAQKRMEKMKTEHRIVGDVRAKGCLMGIELVRDKATKEPFDKAGELVYQKAFRKGLA